MSSTYAGGFANSGLLYPSENGRSSWTVTFSKPGAYHYFCLIHFPYMSGWIVVHPRPTAMAMATVEAGDEGPLTGAKVFFPRTLNGPRR